MLHLIVAAAEAVAEEKNPILPDVAELLYGALAFIIVFAVLAKFAFPALNKMLQERSAKIQGNIDGAEQARMTAEQELAEYRAQLAGARDESNRIIEEARRTADRLHGLYLACHRHLSRHRRTLRARRVLAVLCF